MTTATPPLSGTQHTIRSGAYEAVIASTGASLRVLRHGDRDLIVAPSGGDAAAAAIPHARHIVVAGMGHHLPDSLALRIADHVVGHLERTLI